MYGANFGDGNAAVTGHPVVSVGGQACWRTVFVSSTHLQCQVPGGSGSNKAVRVQLGGVQSPIRNLFAYKWWLW